jgi:NAD-dependent dihydropyrimidine dehydrogenase PreA subunit
MNLSPWAALPLSTEPQGQVGLMQTFHQAWRARGPSAWLASGLLFLFYTLLYFTEALSPLAASLGLPSKWLLYGLLYSLAMVLGAAQFLRQHGNNPYHRLRIAVNVAVQVLLAFSLPLVLPWFGQPEVYLSYLWPLDMKTVQPDFLRGLPWYFALWFAGLSLVGAPLLAVLFGKRWYCSWICGCGGLANTFGDPWRHLTSTSPFAWRVERATVHGVLVLALLATVLVVLRQLGVGQGTAFEGWSYTVQQGYGFWVGALLSGVVGTAVYPLLGPRFWCRNFCPMAALLGLTQKLGRFHIRVKPDLCISCGNCSTYCEMGIDVRDYAQRNESFTRASCVGCGMCAHVCPRGVLRLENEAWSIHPGR